MNQIKRYRQEQQSSHRSHSQSGDSSSNRRSASSSTPSYSRFNNQPLRPSSYTPPANVIRDDGIRVQGMSVSESETSPRNETNSIRVIGLSSPQRGGDSRDSSPTTSDDFELIEPEDLLAPDESSENTDSEERRNSSPLPTINRQSYGRGSNDLGDVLQSTRNKSPSPNSETSSSHSNSEGGATETITVDPNQRRNSSIDPENSIDSRNESVPQQGGSSSPINITLSPPQAETTISSSPKISLLVRFFFFKIAIISSY